MEKLVEIKFNQLLGFQLTLSSISDLSDGERSFPTREPGTLPFPIRAGRNSRNALL
jgi:hypothetical protein